VYVGTLLAHAMFFTTAFCIPLIGTTPDDAFPLGAATLPLAAAAGAAGAARAPPAAALSISSATMRPPGPVPTTVFKSTPLDSASERANGEATTRPPAGGAAGAAAREAAAGAAAGMAAGAGAGACFADFGCSPAAMSTSSSVTRPKLPVPGISIHLRPLDFASFLAAGEAILFGDT
jgi:hypothetical protein